MQFLWFENNMKFLKTLWLNISKGTLWLGRLASSFSCPRSIGFVLVHASGTFHPPSCICCKFQSGSLDSQRCPSCIWSRYSPKIVFVSICNFIILQTRVTSVELKYLNIAHMERHSGFLLWSSSLVFFSDLLLWQLLLIWFYSKHTVIKTQTIFY